MTTQLRCFFMSDVERSNLLWATQSDAMAEAVTGLDSEVDAAVEGCAGRVIKPRGEGDSHFAVFSLASDAVLAACALQSRLVEPMNGLQLRVRIALHVGEASAIGDDYYGVPVNQTARLRAIAHGGQTVVSSVMALLARPALADRVVLRSLGHHRVRDFPRLEEVFQASSPTDARTFPALHSRDTHGPALMAVAMADICATTSLLRDLSERDRSGAATRVGRLDERPRRSSWRYRVEALGRWVHRCVRGPSGLPGVRAGLPSLGCCRRLRVNGRRGCRTRRAHRW